MLKLIVRISTLFAALIIMLELYNYFDGLIKLFSDLYLAKFLDISTKPFFPCALEYHFSFIYTFLLLIFE